MSHTLVTHFKSHTPYRSPLLSEPHAHNTILHSLYKTTRSLGHTRPLSIAKCGTLTMEPHTPLHTCYQATCHPKLLLGGLPFLSAVYHLLQLVKVSVNNGNHCYLSCCQKKLTLSKSVAPPQPVRQYNNNR